MNYQEPDSDIIERIQDKMDQVMFEENEHHEYCPVINASKRYPGFSTLCMCHELRKADREAAAEDRAEDDFKYGGL